MPSPQYPPFYYKFNADDIFSYYRDISESISIPMIVYNIGLAGLMSNDLVKRIASVENVKGLKFTGREHDDMCALKQELGPDFMIYSGCDEMATQGLLAGADGLIGSTYNLMPDTAIEIYKLAQKGDYVAAFEIQKIVTKLIHYIVQWDFFPIMKNLITASGVDAGYSRRPFTTPSKEVMDKIHTFCLDLKNEHKGNSHIAFIDKM